jgi:CheY-like chemotaxis protein
MNDPRSESPLRSLRILVAEDGLVHQRFAMRMLHQQGHHVTIANNGNEVLASLDRDHFDVILMDVEMPELDGLSTTRRIRHREQGGSKRQAIVALTSTNNREECLEAGMDAYLSKPLDPALLAITLERVLQPTVV